MTEKETTSAQGSVPASAPSAMPVGVPTEDGAAAAAEILREHDTSSRYRTNLGVWAWIIGGVSIALTLFHLYTGIFGTRPSLIQGAVHLAGGTSLIFLLFPAYRGALKKKGVPWYDAILALLALAVNLYIVVQYTHLTSNLVQILGYTTLDYVVASLGVLLVLEATRRCVGIPIVVVAGIAIIYGLFATGSSWGDYATGLFFTARSGIFGTPIQVSSTFIFLFLLFAVVLIHTNIGQFFNDLAFRAAGRFTGGPAKAAIAASGLQGMISGSSVANTVASGSFTIPMMKKVGFKPHVAGATEATASTGGQIMPPIMGAAAFIMAEYTGIAYSEIIVIAIIPAALYFLGVMLSVHFEAKRTGIRGLAKHELPTWRSLLVRIDLIIPLAMIVTMMLSGFSPGRAALWGIAAAVLLSFLRRSTRLGLLGLLKMLEEGARTALPVIAACAAAGIVASTVTGTGLGGRLGNAVLALSGGNFLAVLMLTMLASLILGMGLPTTANYVVTATVAAPILYNNFDVPLIAAHMFVFFFGILADITPPVCLAAFAGAGIAGANPMRTGVTAIRLAIAAFLIPYVFVLEPALLLEGPVSDLIPALTTLIIGMMAISASLAGYFLGRTNRLENVMLLAGGVLLVAPILAVSLIGLGLVVVVGVFQVIRRRNGGDDDEADEDEAPAASDAGAAPSASGA